MMAITTTSTPATLNEWLDFRQEARATLWRLLGDMPPLFTPAPTVTATEARDGYTLHKFEFDNGLGDMVYGYLLIPDDAHHPFPAILYCHAHGGNYDIGKDELFQNRFNLGIQPGVELVRQGYVVLAIDAYTFCERQGKGPGGADEIGKEAELTLAKKFLWEGRTLWGMMLRDDLLALNYLTSLPEVDLARIGATGMSLGGSRTTWLAALDERIKVAIPVAQMNRYQEFAASGEYVRHGMYYYVPGALCSGVNMEHIAALTAPRPQLILIGDSDPLSPIVGVHIIDSFVQGIYGLYGAGEQFQTVIEPGIAHQYTPDMWSRMLVWFGQYL
jgi:dienelactone hydrolase